MAENAGKLQVEYVVKSDDAMRRLNQLEKYFNKVTSAANKQEKVFKSAYKKMAKTAGVFGAVMTGMLYGIIKASSYAAMWTDQVGHSITRLANKILEITGLKEGIEFFIGVLEKLADKLEDPEGTKFWAELAEDFSNLSTKSKIATIAIIVLISIIGVLTALGIGSWFYGTVAAAGAFATKIGLATIITKGLTAATMVLKGVLAFIGGTVGLLIIAIAALVVYLGYLWATSEHGQAQIQSLINVWNNFKINITEMGWIDAIIQAIKNLGIIVIVEIMHMIKTMIKLFIEWGTAMYDFALSAGSKILQYLIAGFESMFKPIIDSFLYIYDNFWLILDSVKTMAYDKAREIYEWLITGLTSFLPWVIDSFWYIYDNFWDILENIKILAYNKGREIYQWLVDGLASALGWVIEQFEWIGELWGMESDAVVIAANHTGEDMMKSMANGVDTISPVLDASATTAGQRASDGLRSGINGASDSVCDEMVSAIHCAENGASGINSALDQIVKDISVNVNINQTSSGGSSSGGSSGGGGGGGWKLSGWKNTSATGGHVMRTGTNTVHQGEDIIHLKSLLSGIKSGATEGNNITINPVINISTSGKMSDPFEANRVADVVSKRMAEELRRITPTI